MKRKHLITLIVIGSLFGIYQLLAVSGLFVVYRNETWANEPSLKEGKMLFSTNLISPEPGDFVTYEFKYPDSLFSHTRIHRLVAMENDILEIKKGVLYVNGTNFDKNYSLTHEYKISIEEFNKFDMVRREIGEEYRWLKPQDTISKFIDDRIAEQLNLKERKVVEDKSVTDKSIEILYNKQWNKDSFGPFKIPLGKVFIMGDNRDQSEDSRFIGPIDRSDIKGVLIK